MQSNDRKVLTVKEVSEQLGLGLHSTYRALHNGDIPSVRIGGRILIPVEAFERLLAGKDGQRLDA